MEPILVSADVSVAIVKNELDKAMSMNGGLFEIVIDPNDGRLFTATLKSLPINGVDNTFIFYFDCSNYKFWPPLIKMVDPETKEIDIFNAYPAGKDSLFNKHNKKPIICKEFNRGAYDFYNGIHSSDWKLPQELLNGFDWAAKIPAINNLSAILYHLWKKLNTPGYVMGRMIQN